MNRNFVLLVLGLAALLVCATGCFSSRSEDIKAFTMPVKTDVYAPTYVLEPPDVIEVLCTDVPELHLQSQRIRPDGLISFEGIGEIRAAGKTPAQLAEDLRQKMEPLYTLATDHPVDVRITTYQSKSFYVLGHARRIGAKDFTGRDTVLDAVAEAGPINISWLEVIQVIRPSADPTVPPKIFKVNFDRLMAHGDTSKNVLLQEGDIVYIPPTVLGWMGLKIEELVSPLGRAFSTANTVNPGRRD
jgi:polysaccharide export outer membrane protein